jgi:hypothetical protein
VPGPKRRLAGALLAAVAGVALCAQAPAPQAAAPAAAGQHGPGRPGSYPHPHSGTHQPYPNVIIYGTGYAETPATPRPKHRATPRPAGAPEVFETHSTAQ